MTALHREFSAAGKPYKRIIAIRRYAARRRYESLVPIRTLDDALDWGDSWMRAYAELLADARRQADALQERILMLETELNIRG